MKNGVKLINQRGEQVTRYKKNEPLRIIFPVEHVKGQEAVGLDAVNNPKVIINTNITDKDNKVISQEKIQTPKILLKKAITPINRMTVSMTLIRFYYT